MVAVVVAAEVVAVATAADSSVVPAPYRSGLDSDLADDSRLDEKLLALDSSDCQDFVLAGQQDFGLGQRDLDGPGYRDCDPDYLDYGRDYPGYGPDCPGCDQDCPDCGRDCPDCGRDFPDCGRDCPDYEFDDRGCDQDCGRDYPDCGASDPGYDARDFGTGVPDCGSDDPDSCVAGT